MANNKTEELEKLEVRSSKLEKYTKLGTGLVSSLGPIGAVIGTIINESISSAQQSRMVDFVNELFELYKKQNKELEDIKTAFEKMFADSCNTLLFELAMKASANSNSNKIHHCYAYYIFKIINSKQLNDIQQERLFRLITSLSEYEILMLIGYSIPRALGKESDFDNKYHDILFPKSRELKSPMSNQIFNAFYDQYNISLEQKGLIAMPLQLKQTKNELVIEKKKPTITKIGQLVVQAIYDEDFFFKCIEKK